MMGKKRSIIKFICFICAVYITISIYPNNSYSEILIFDDFEYWSSPQNFGWQTSEPAFPALGYGIGYGSIRTLLDFQEGSRVLEVLYNPSVFNRMEPFTIFNLDTIDPKTGKYIDKKVISFKIWSEFAVESFQLFQFGVLIKTKSNKNLRINYLAVDGSTPKLVNDQVVVNLGRGYQDGTWHTIVRDLEEDLQKAQPGEELDKIVGLVVQGCRFRLDDIHFHDDMDFLNNHPPELWRIGPQFATIFTDFFLTIAARDPDGDFLEFKATIGGYGANGLGPTNFLYRLPLDPNDPQSGMIPDVVGLYFIPYTFDDLVITIKVTDGLLSDVETFTLSVVNFPIMGINHPPYLEQLDKAVGYVGTKLDIPILARDIDNTDILTYSATIDGQTSYQYGPWQQSIIDPFTGVISFTPVFEGKHWIEITVRDSRGMYAQGGFELVIANPGTWFNHAPVITKKIQNPQITKAGIEYSIPIDIVDPDGDKLYYSCNLGTITERQDGVQGCVFSFFTNFPGQYVVTIIAYDIRGLFTEERFLLDVQPWWSS